MMDKMINPTQAAGAYANTARIPAVKTEQVAQSGESFADFMRGKLDQSIETMKSGETMSARAVTDDADLTDVVQAVTSAELTLQTVVAIRDRLVSAYQDLMRMPI
jgi:flagellar hook-basal body complex protein FliE